MSATEGRPGCTLDGVTGQGPADDGPAVKGPADDGSAVKGPADDGSAGGGDGGPTTAELLARIEELTRRVEWLEANLADGPRAPTTLPPEVVLAISAAVAAYLGKRATVRQVHLRSHSTWAKQGRAQVMASHGFAHGTR